MRVLLVVVGIAVLANGQSATDSPSLGDVARAYRMQKTSHAAAKTITNEEIASSSGTAHKPGTTDAEVKPDPTQTARARELLAEIRERKSAVEGLEHHMAELKSEMQNGTNPPGRRMLQRLNNEYAGDQQRLNRERTALEQLQEEARRLGFGNAAYDPD